MTGSQQLQAELTVLMGQLVEICKNHRYDVTPTIVLRHEEGWTKSVVVSNDSLEEVAKILLKASRDFNQSSMSPWEGRMRLLLDGGEGN